MFPAKSIILAIETSNPSSGYSEGDGPGVAFGRQRAGAEGIEVLGVELLHPTGRNDDGLMPAIGRLASRIGVTPPQIGRVAVSVGPGGYTAMRIAIASAKMIAEVAGAETVAVPTATVAARLASPTAELGRFAVVLASKSDLAFVTVFGPDRGAEHKGFMAQSTDIEHLFQGDDPVLTLIADHFLPKGFRQMALDQGRTVESLRLNPTACLQASCGLQAVDPAALSPLDGREPEAVTLWRARHPQI